MSSFEEMFSRYFGRVYKFALKLTRSTEQAEDITQQTFYRALEKIDSFEGRSDVGTWLCSIAKNEYFDRCRKRKETAAEPGSRVLDRRVDDVAMGVQLQSQQMQIHRHLHELDEPYREVFMLRVFGELRYAQIASLFGRTESWARVTFISQSWKFRNGLRRKSMEKIKCEVIRDLMPLVADDVASEESKELVSGHMEVCEVCKAYFAGMTAQIMRSAMVDDGPTSTFISFSKQMEKRVRMKKVLTALTAAFIALCVVIVGVCIVADRMNTTVVMPIENTQAWLWHESNGEVNLAIQMAEGYGWYHHVGWHRDGDVFYITPYEPEWKLWNKGTHGGLSKEFVFDLLWENENLYYRFVDTDTKYDVETGCYEHVEEEYKIPIRYVRWGDYSDYTTLYEEGDTIMTRKEVYELMYPSDEKTTAIPRISASPAPIAEAGEGENPL